MAVVERSYLPTMPPASRQQRPTAQQNNVPEQNWLAPVAETVEQVSDTIGAVSDITSAAADLIWGPNPEDRPSFINGAVDGLESLSAFAERTSETTAALRDGNFATANLFASWFSGSSVASSSSSSSTASTSGTTSYAGSSSSTYESGDEVDPDGGTEYSYPPLNATAEQIRVSDFNRRTAAARNAAVQIMALIPQELQMGTITPQQLRDLNIDIGSLLNQISVLSSDINHVMAGVNADLASQLNSDVLDSISGAQAFTNVLSRISINPETPLESFDGYLAVQGGRNRSEPSRAGGGENNNPIDMRDSFLTQRGIIFSDASKSEEQADNSTDTGSSIYAPSPVGTISVYTPRNAAASSFANNLALTG